MTKTHRLQSAVTAAAAVARGLGMTPVDPVILRDSNHVSIRLLPFAMVARVIVTEGTEDAVADLARELDVARHVAGQGGPIVRPAAGIPPGPHVEGRAALTLWTYFSHASATDADASIAAKALRVVHEAMDSYSGELPAFTDAIERSRLLLQDGSSLPGLPPSDRTFLLSQCERLLGSVAVDMNHVPLHGDPHLGNVLITSEGALWTDFESACRGPLQWDLSAIPDAALVSFPSVDGDLLAKLRDLRSLCVAVWCWKDIDRGPDKCQAAQFHLDRLRRRTHEVSTI